MNAGLSTVSVIIPTFCHRNLVGAAIESVLSQTRRPNEIIVIDDGSADGTAEVLGPYARSDRIRVHRRANGGVASARNMGLDIARGDVIAYLDDDDLWPRDSLEWRLRVLEDDTSLAAVGGTCEGFYVIPGDGRIHGAVWCDRQRPRPADFLRRNLLMSPGQVIVRREALRDVGGFDTALWGADDFDLWLKLTQKHALDLCPRLALFYRLHGANASRNSIQMLSSTRRVVARYLPTVAPPDRPACRRASHKWQWSSYVGPVIDELRASLRSRRLRSAGSAALRLARMLVMFGRDPMLYRHVVERLLRGRRVPVGDGSTGNTNSP